MLTRVLLSAYRCMAKIKKECQNIPFCVNGRAESIDLGVFQLVLRPLTDPQV